MVTNDPKFILIVDGEGVRSLVQVGHLTHIKESVRHDGTYAITAKIIGKDEYFYIAAGPDSRDYFNWLMSKVDVLDFWGTQESA